MTVLVFHLIESDPKGRMFMVRSVKQALELWEGNGTPAFYRIVAVVDTDDLETAYRLTNHIDRDWRENPGVQVIPGAGLYRSTSVGDMALVVGKGPDSLHFCASFGWEPIPTL
jgi:hypothetical protein